MKFITLICILLFTISVNGDQFPPELPSRIPPIEEELKRCREKANNAGLITCTNTAYKQYDVALKDIYTILKNKLKEKTDAHKKLIQSQKKWLQYRDKEFQYINQIHQDVLEGTYWFSENAEQRIKIVRHRVEELENYLNCLCPYIKG